MTALEKNMLGLSVFLHALLMGLFFLPSFFGVRFSKPNLEAAGPVALMWADVVTGPKTPENKLPGPMVPLQAPIKPDPSMVKIDPELKAPPQAKKRTLDDALKSLGSDEEKRPRPRLDNFAAVEGAKAQGLPAAPGMGGGNLTLNPNVMGYKRTLQTRITQNFVWLGTQKNLKCEVGFKILPDGTLVSPQVVQSSGNTSFDQSGLRAVLKSSPLPAPPKGEHLENEMFVIAFEPKN